MLTLNLSVTESFREKKIVESLQYLIANIYRLLSECSIGWNLRKINEAVTGIPISPF